MYVYVCVCLCVYVCVCVNAHMHGYLRRLEEDMRSSGAGIVSYLTWMLEIKRRSSGYKMREEPRREPLNL